MTASAADDPRPAHALGAVAVVAVVTIGAIVAVAFGAVLIDRDLDEQTPQASFSFAYDEQAGELTVKHAGGDAIDGRHLYVMAGNRTVGNFSTYPTVQSGDRVTVSDVGRNEAVRVVWRREGQSLVLARRS